MAVRCRPQVRALCPFSKNPIFLARWPKRFSQIFSNLTFQVKRASIPSSCWYALHTNERGRCVTRLNRKIPPRGRRTDARRHALPRLHVLFFFSTAGRRDLLFIKFLKFLIIFNCLKPQDFRRAGLPRHRLKNYAVYFSRLGILQQVDNKYS